MAHSVAMIAKRLAFALLAAAAAFVYFTRPVAQKSLVTVQHAAPLPQQQQPPSLLSKDGPKPAPAAQKSPEESAPINDAADKALRGRVTAYWRARTKSDLLTAFTFYEPKFRSQYTPQEFLLKFQRLVRFKPVFVAIDRIRYEAGGSKAVAFIRLRTRPDVIPGQELESVTEETWMLLSGTWYRQAEPLLPSF
jgi:hypothetical protein